FNIAQTRRKMGNFTGALDAYQAFLHEQPRVHPKVRSQAEQYIAFCQLMVQPLPGKPGTAVAQQQPPQGSAPQQQLAMPLPGAAGEDEYAALIPASAVADGFAYYLEAYDSLGNGPARSGSPDLPHAVAVEEGQTPLSNAVAGAIKGASGTAPEPAAYREGPPP